MNKEILNIGVQDFITKNLNTDIMSVLLKKPPFEGISTQELAQQIESKKKCEKKLPLWFNTPRIFYPKRLNIEQTSSEITAQYKSNLVAGKLLADLTGGFGIDSYFFSKKMQTVFHCEIDPELHEISKHNFDIFGLDTITSYLGDGLVFIQDCPEQFNWLYLDPSRRTTEKEKVFRLSDCTPNVIEHLDLLFSKTDNILIKTAPLLDITAGIADLKSVKEIHIIAVNGEVKELLWHLKKDYFGDTQIKTGNFVKTGWQKFDYSFGEEKNTDSSFDLPLTYLYEPNAAILKSGAFKTLGKRFSLQKIHRHTHLYTSEELIPFPGRRFRIQKIYPYDKRISAFLNKLKANVAVRNFSLNVADIKKKFKITDGGNSYLFFTKDYNDRLLVLSCQKA